MLSTSSYSKTLIKENCSRYWAIPVLGLIAFFLAGILPILMNFRSFKLVSNHAETVMMGASFSINTIIVMLAITSSVLVFSYLHNQVSSTAMHSMPADRKKLFGSAVISGWVLTVIPIVIFAFLMLTLRGATTDPNLTNIDYMSSSLVTGTLSAKAIYTFPHVLGFIVTSVVSATFAYAVSCLAAVLAGRTNIHALLAPFLFVLPNTIAAMIEGLCNGYLYGFKELNVKYELLNATSYALTKDGFGLELGYVAYFIALSAVILAISMWVYSKIKLERIGNATTFPIVGDALATLLAVICSVEFAHLFVIMTSSSEKDKHLRFIITVLIASVVFYAIMRMIADSSFAIFNQRNLKQYAICLAIIALITAFMVLDVTGYGKKTPLASEVASVHVNTSFPNGLYTVDEDCSDPAIIESLSELQEAIIDERYVEIKKNSEGYEDYTSEDFTLVWKLKNGKVISRRYEALEDGNHKKTEAALKKLYNTQEFKKLLTIDADKELKRCKTVDIYPANSMEEPEMTYIKKEDWTGLIDAVNKDLSKATYEELNNYSDWEGSSGDKSIWLEFNYKTADDEVGRSFKIREEDKNTTDYLKSKGYLK